GAVKLPANTGEQINLTPADIGALRRAELEAQKTTQPKPMETPAAVTTPEPATVPAEDPDVDAPSGIPVPTDLESPVTDEVSTDTRTADVGTTEVVEGSIPSPEENEPQEGFDDTQMFPPAALAADEVLVHNGVEIPL